MVQSQNCLKCIFANKGNCGKRFGAVLYYLKYSGADPVEWGDASPNISVASPNQNLVSAVGVVMFQNRFNFR